MSSARIVPILMLFSMVRVGFIFSILDVGKIFIRRIARNML